MEMEKEEIKYRGRVINPQIGILVSTRRGIGRITDSNDTRELYYVEFENGARPAWYRREMLRNP